METTVLQFVRHYRHWVPLAVRVAGTGVLCQKVVCIEAATSLKKLTWKIQVSPGRDKCGKGIWLVDRQV